MRVERLEIAGLGIDGERRDAAGRLLARLGLRPAPFDYGISELIRRVKGDERRIRRGPGQHRLAEFAGRQVEFAAIDSFALHRPSVGAEVDADFARLFVAVTRGADEGSARGREDIDHANFDTRFLLCERRQLILWKRLDRDVLPMHFLRLFVRVQLQTDWGFFDPVRFGLAPVADEFAVEHEADAVSLRKNFDVVPIVLLADRLRDLGVGVNAAATVEIEEAVVRREHDQVPRIGERVFLFRCQAAPHRQARVHFGLRQLEVEREAEVAELAFGEQVGADRNRVGVLADDDAVFHAPVLADVAGPTGQILAVEELDGFAFASAGRNVGSVGGDGRLSECTERKDDECGTH